MIVVLSVVRNGRVECSFRLRVERCRACVIVLNSVEIMLRSCWTHVELMLNSCWKVREIWFNTGIQHRLLNGNSGLIQSQNRSELTKIWRPWQQHACSQHERRVLDDHGMESPHLYPAARCMLKILLSCSPKIRYLYVETVIRQQQICKADLMNSSL